MNEKLLMRLGLSLIAVDAKKGGLKKHETSEAIRKAARKVGLGASAQEIRNAVNIAYQGGAK